MAIPSGGGSEVLKRAYCANWSQGAATTYIDWAAADGETDASQASAVATRVPADVILTILNIVVCRFNGGANTFTVKLEHASNDDIYLLDAQDIPGNGTFVYSDRIILLEGDELSFQSAGDETDCWINYIKQDWSQEKT